MWRENKLVFEATQLREIAQMLKETYNLDVSVDDERLLQERITGTIPSGSVKELLSALSAALRVKYIQENNQVKFY
jgi:ferric-dicitrate binding protein FerR (iron transport regulator)